METEDLNNAETLVKDVKIIKDTIHNLQFILTNPETITYLRDMSQGVEADWHEEVEKAYELIAQAEEEEINFKRENYHYGE